MTTTDKSRADALTDDRIEQIARNHCPDMPDDQVAVPHLKAAIYEALDAVRPVERHEATPADAARMSKGVRDVLAERHRQILHEGMTPDQDDRYTEAELSRAAAAYILSACGFSNAITLDFWPWSTDWWKPTTPRRNLVKAAALIFAEMERLDRDPGDESHHDHLNGGSL
ncbi:hypothetical protein [Burkholderia cepacia]|uniref:hypothetical protein n=1 Tax=Burkholderia cepacia TaxID=292 RepID=UPI002FE424AF